MKTLTSLLLLFLLNIAYSSAQAVTIKNGDSIPLNISKPEKIYPDTVVFYESKMRVLYYSKTDTLGFRRIDNKTIFRRI